MYPKIHLEAGAGGEEFDMISFQSGSTKKRRLRGAAWCETKLFSQIQFIGRTFNSFAFATASILLWTFNLE